MTDHITIRLSDGTWTVRAGGAILAETTRGLELREGSYPPVVYIPREDVAMALFERSPTRTTCPHKGEASYYSFVGKSARIADAAWSYETPKDGVAPIAGHLAFYSNRVTLERA
ncbi:DUF427 domain-containing protein [Rubellimicrobium aerolatum]|uniref:DUF427 domain-containing protein n=1 Tax=Rubellimicrobium aerolatum TaxID=490979 RepID=A0ABW0S6X6_9RHOB|nr:DUF427 domain-containing protein [Rubellimicrobium aerolatum]MBP1804598.1 uncharacterized protein (DUF427 family) [Rubellimicrobium aerolatum]